MILKFINKPQTFEKEFYYQPPKFTPNYTKNTPGRGKGKNMSEFICKLLYNRIQS